MTAASARAAMCDLTEWATTRTGLTIPEIALKFESLGENCEFGLFQRRCDAEPLGLLRFSSTFMRNLIRGIDSGFDGLGAIEDIDPRLEGTPRKEYMIHEKKFGLVYHTFVYEGQRSVWLMREQESARLKFLRRKFMEELEVSDKIFVYKFARQRLGGGDSAVAYGAEPLWRGNAAVGRAGGTRPSGRHGRGADARPAEGLYRPVRAGQQRARFLLRRLAAGLRQRLRAGPPATPGGRTSAAWPATRRPIRTRLRQPGPKRRDGARRDANQPAFRPSV